MEQSNANLLLQAMMSGQLQVDQAQALFEQYLAQRSAEDPRIGMLMNLVAQQRAAAEAAQAAEDEIYEPVYDQPPMVEAHDPEPAQRQNHEKANEIKQKVREIYLELRELRRRNLAFADAVGACSNCWGSDPSCAFCMGNGRPGAYQINTSLFAELVAPAMVQYQQLNRAKASSFANPASDRDR
jgi:hypothetical protein